MTSDQLATGGGVFDARGYIAASQELEKMLGGDPNQASSPLADGDAKAKRLRRLIETTVLAASVDDPGEAEREAELMRREELACVLAAGGSIEPAAPAPVAPPPRAENVVPFEPKAARSLSESQSARALGALLRWRDGAELAIAAMKETTLGNNNYELAKAEKHVAAAEASVASAKSVVVGLEEKRTAAIARGTELADERANVALAAHTGDEKAAQRLQEIHQAIAIHGSELASLDAALRAAAQKVEAAQSVVAVATQKLDAIKLRAVSRAFVAQLRKIDAALDAVVNCLFDVEPIRAQLTALGVGPSHEQFFVLGERPILMAIGDTDFEGRIGRRLAPHERMSFTALAEAWARQHDTVIAHILGEEQTKSTEAA